MDECIVRLFRDRDAQVNNNVCLKRHLNMG